MQADRVVEKNKLAIWAPSTLLLRDSIPRKSASSGLNILISMSGSEKSVEPRELSERGLSAAVGGVLMVSDRVTPSIRRPRSFSAISTGGNPETTRFAGDALTSTDI